MSEFENWHLNATVYKDRVEEIHYISDPAKNIRRQQCIRVWHIEQSLGRGGFGEVRLEKNMEDGQARAVKRIGTAGAGLTNSEVAKELQALLEFSKPKSREAAVFIDFFGWFRDGSDIFLAMEYVQLGDLERNVAQLGKVPEGEARDIAEQILSGLEIMHAQAFAHRDLKPHNVLVVNGPPQWWVKIADFGLSKRLTDASAFHTRSGSLSYMAPEVLNYLPGSSATSAYTNAVDIWATGCIIYRIICGVVPFPPGTSLMKFCEDSSLFPLEPLFDSGVKSEGFKFIRSMLVTNPKGRPSASDALKHKWISPEAITLKPVLDSSIIPSVDVSTHSNAVSSDSGWNTASHAGLKSVRSSTQLTSNQDLPSHTASSSTPNLGRVPSASSLKRKPVPESITETTTRAPILDTNDNNITIKPLNNQGNHIPMDAAHPRAVFQGEASSIQSGSGYQGTEQNTISTDQIRKPLVIDPFHDITTIPARSKDKDGKPLQIDPFENITSIPIRGKDKHGNPLPADPFQNITRTPAQTIRGNSSAVSALPSMRRPDTNKLPANETRLPVVESARNTVLAERRKDNPSNSSRLTPASVSSALRNKSVTRVRAIYTFESTERGDLTFRKGEIIAIIGPDVNSSDWWEGYIGDRKGIFPLNYVEHEMKNGRIYPRQATYARVRAIHKFLGSPPEMLSLQPGDICFVAEIKSNDELKVICVGPNGLRQGWVPRYVIEDLPLPTPKDFFSGKITRVKALSEFSGERPGDLVFKEGDIIRILEPKDDDWWIGEVRGRSGIFPLTHTEVLPERDVH